jgi:predicted metalloendopeptidase
MGLSRSSPELQRIAAISDPLSLQDEIANLHAHRIPAVFGFGASQDFKDSTQIIAQLVQGGLGLPDRDYYLSDDPKNKATRAEYEKHVARTFELMGDAPDLAAKEASTVVKIETKLAENSATRIQRRNPEANYHPMTKGALIELTPDFDWGRYFRNINLPEVGKVNVGQPDFFKGPANFSRKCRSRTGRFTCAGTSLTPPRTLCHQSLSRRVSTLTVNIFRARQKCCPAGNAACQYRPRFG